MPSFGIGAKTSLRQSIDVLHITELREADVIKLAIQASENNILILASIHSNSIADTTDRIAMAFPQDEQYNITNSLANQVTLIINQRLVRCNVIKEIVQRDDGYSYPVYETEVIDGVESPVRKRKAVYEVITSSPKIRDAIRKKDIATMMDSIYDEMKRDNDGKLGIKLLDRELATMVV